MANLSQINLSLDKGQIIRKGMEDFSTGPRTTISHSGDIAIIWNQYREVKVLDVRKRVLMPIIRDDKIWSIEYPVFSDDDQYILFSHNGFGGFNVMKVNMGKKWDLVFTNIEGGMTEVGFAQKVQFNRFQRDITNRSMAWGDNNNEFYCCYGRYIMKVDIPKKEVTMIFDIGVVNVYEIIYDKKLRNIIFTCTGFVRMRCVNVDTKQCHVCEENLPNFNVYRQIILTPSKRIVAFDDNSNLYLYTYPSLKPMCRTGTDAAINRIKACSDGEHIFVDYMRPEKRPEILKIGLFTSVKLNFDVENNHAANFDISRDGTTIVHAVRKEGGNKRGVGILSVDPPPGRKLYEKFNHFQSLMIGMRMKRKLPKYLMVIIARHAYTYI